MPSQQVWATPRHVALRRNFGKATALMIGIGACAGDVVITGFGRKPRTTRG